jgi:putative ABC transport system substrate-binding protein
MISRPFVSLMRVAGPALIFAGLLAALPTGAPQQANVPVVGWLGFSGDSIARDGPRQGLRELGYAEGQNIAIEHLLPEGRGDPFAGPIEELVHLKVNIIISAGVAATAAVRRADVGRLATARR